MPAAAIPTMPITLPARSSKFRDEALLDERRLSVRACRRIHARLLGRGGAEALATTSDVSEGGLFAQFPAGSGVTVGQRFEVTLSDESEAPDLACFLSAGCYATIVRTERRVKNDMELVGAGMRFDQPLLF